MDSPVRQYLCSSHRKCAHRTLSTDLIPIRTHIYRNCFHSDRNWTIFFIAFLLRTRKHIRRVDVCFPMHISSVPIDHGVFPSMSIHPTDQPSRIHHPFSHMCISIDAHSTLSGSNHLLDSNRIFGRSYARVQIEMSVRPASTQKGSVYDKFDSINISAKVSIYTCVHYTSYAKWKRGDRRDTNVGIDCFWLPLGWLDWIDFWLTSGRLPPTAECVSNIHPITGGDGSRCLRLLFVRIPSSH